MADQKAVAGNKDVAKDASEAGSETPETLASVLESMEREEEAQSKPAPTAAEALVDAANDTTLEARLNQVESRIAQREDSAVQKELNREFKTTIKRLSEDEALNGKFNADDIEAHLRLRIMRDEKIGQAFARREENPALWDRLERAFVTELAARGQAIPGDAPADRQAAEKSARGVSNHAPSAGSTMTQAELNELAQSDPRGFKAYKDSLL